MRIPIPRTTVIQLIKTHGILCQHCQKEEFEHIHHIDKDPSNNGFSNLMLLCTSCHGKKHRTATLDISKAPPELPMSDLTIQRKLPKAQIQGYKCLRCKHTWIARNKNRLPKICPKCKSPQWSNRRYTPR